MIQLVKLIPSYRCDICGGWIDYTGRKHKGRPVFRHRSKAKAKKCMGLWAVRVKSERGERMLSSLKR